MNNNYFKEDLIVYDIEQFGGEYVYQPKKNYDWASFGLGVAGGVSTALWYSGVTTVAFGGLPFFVGGIVCTGVSMYLVMPEQMTTKDKLVLTGALAASATLGFAVVNNGVGYALMSASIFAISYKSDSHDILKQISTSLSGWNLGFAAGYKAVVFAAQAVNEAKRESIGEPFAPGYNPANLPIIRGVKDFQHKTGLEIKFHGGAQIPTYLTPEEGGTYALRGGRASIHYHHPDFADSGKPPVNIPFEDGGLIGRLHDIGCLDLDSGSI